MRKRLAMIVLSAAMVAGVVSASAAPAMATNHRCTTPTMCGHPKKA
jgi:hypothetical protein